MADAPEKPPIKGRFVKGQSGNPGGRPRTTGVVRELAWAHCEEAIKKLIDLMRHSADERIQLSAAETLLDRGIGKHMQAIEHSGPDGGCLPSVTVRFLDPTKG